MIHIIRMYETYHQQFKYIFFGFLTTTINIGCYFLLRHYLQISVIWANSLALCISIIFAFVVNKFFVFNIRTVRAKILIQEFATFISLRIVTAGVDTVLMVVFVHYFAWNALVIKVIINVIVIIMNYFISKDLIFKKE